jgi:hypothetical protein
MSRKRKADSDGAPADAIAQRDTYTNSIAESQTDSHSHANAILATDEEAVALELAVGLRTTRRLQ